MCIIFEWQLLHVKTEGGPQLCSSPSAPPSKSGAISLTLFRRRLRLSGQKANE